MKKRKIIFVTLLMLLSSCSEPVSNIIEGNTITFKDTYSIESVFLSNPNSLTNDLKKDTINYFVSNGSHFAKSSEYIFIYKNTLNGRDFKVTLTYDSTKETNEFYFACSWFLDNQDTYPNSSYFFSTNFNIVDFKEQKFDSYFCYSHKEKEEIKNDFLKISYYNIQYSTCPNFKQANFSIENYEQFQKIRSEETLEKEGFECIKVGAVYLNNLLTAVSSNYHLF